MYKSEDYVERTCVASVMFPKHSEVSWYAIRFGYDTPFRSGDVVSLSCSLPLNAVDIAAPSSKYNTTQTEEQKINAFMVGFDDCRSCYATLT